ncbi:MAG: response regulator [Alphaproteobacteria bacterium]|nr:response regulator [Alphaproteobacteria bacterium]
MMKATNSVVVVDDNKQIRDLVRSVLSSIGIINIIEAENGAEALKVLASSKAELAIIDRQMDVMDGLECTRQIRKGVAGIDPGLSIILLTGVLVKNAEKDAYEAGVDLYMEKPFSVKALFEGIAKVRALDR